MVRSSDECSQQASLGEVRMVSKGQNRKFGFGGLPFFTKKNGEMIP